VAEPRRAGNGNGSHLTQTLDPRDRLAEDETRELSEILRTLSDDIGDLIDTQMKLVVVETKEEVRATAESARWFGGAGLCAYMAVVLFSFAAAWGLTEVVPEGVAFLLVGIVYAVAAAFLLMLGRGAARAIDFPPPETKKSIEEDKRWLAQQRS
jgi:hypothetical protein